MVEGDVSISNYVDGEGKPRQGLNITQRMHLLALSPDTYFFIHSSTHVNFKRPPRGLAPSLQPAGCGG